MFSFTVTCQMSGMTHPKRASTVPGRELEGKDEDHGVRGKTAEGIRHLTVLLNVMGALLKEKWHWGTKSVNSRPLNPEAEAGGTSCLPSA